MTIQTECIGCGSLLSVDEEHAGSAAQCPRCGQTYRVPHVADADVAEDRCDSNPWYLRTPEGKTYGPVGRHVLDTWLSEGRIAADCHLRRGEEDWCLATIVYPELTVTAQPNGNPFAGHYHDPTTASPTRQLEPHRGGLILGLGVAGFLVTCPLLSAIAWMMGNGDLRKMQAGRMDPAGYQVTQVGRIFGMIVSLLWILIFAVVVFLILLALVAI